MCELKHFKGPLSFVYTKCSVDGVIVDLFSCGYIMKDFITLPHRNEINANK